MQLDKGGAMAVIGALETLARMNAPVNVVAVIPAVENMIDANSYKPGAILKSYDVSEGNLIRMKIGMKRMIMSRASMWRSAIPMRKAD